MVDVDALRGTCFGSCERIGDEAPASGLAFGLNLRSEGTCDWSGDTHRTWNFEVETVQEIHEIVNLRS
jgi:hypothetical protein